MKIKNSAVDWDIVKFFTVLIVGSFGIAAIGVAILAPVWCWALSCS